MKSDKRPRQVFGRRRVEIDGVTHLLFMRKDNLMTKELRSALEYKVSFKDLVKYVRNYSGMN